MLNIETEIEALKAQIAMLEKQQYDGYQEVDEVSENYYVRGRHVALWSLDGEILAIIADEEVVRKYFADKDVA